MFLLPILIPAYNSSSLEFLMMCSAYRLNRVTADSPVVLLFQSRTTQLFIQGSNCCFLTRMQVSQETGKMVWYSHLFKSFPQFVMIHTVKGFGVVNETEVDVFLEFPCFLYDPVNVDSLISGSSSFSKPSLDVWKFLVHVVLKPGMRDFKHDLTNMGDICINICFFFLIYYTLYDRLQVHLHLYRWPSFAPFYVPCHFFKQV